METTYEQQALDFLKKTSTELKIVFNRFGSMIWDEKGIARNIFDVTLSNARGSYTFEFGDSLKDSCKELSVLYDPNGKINIGYGISYKNSQVSFSYWKEVSNSKLLAVHTGKASIDSLINDEEFLKQYKILEDEVKSYNKKNKYDKIHCYADNNDLRNKLRNNINKTIEKAINDISYLGLPADEIVIPSAYSILACLIKNDPGDFENFCGEYGYDSDSRKAYTTYENVNEEWEGIKGLFTDEEIEQLSEIN